MYTLYFCPTKYLDKFSLIRQLMSEFSRLVLVLYLQFYRFPGFISIPLNIVFVFNLCINPNPIL